MQVLALVSASLAFALVLAAAAADESALAEAAQREEAEELRLHHLALDRMLEGQARVMRIADRMRIAGASLCGKKVSPVIGVYAPNEHGISDLYPEGGWHSQYTNSFVEAASERYALGRRPRVLLVVPGLAADRAGLRAGDLITAVDGKSEKLGAIDLLRNRGKDGVVRLSVERQEGSETIELELEADMGCTIPSRFIAGLTINAFAMSFGNLTGIYFYSGMLEFLPDDDALAIVVGHELAHLVLGHTSHLRTSKRFEAESDYLGLYFAARAGYDISLAPEVWDEFARSNPYASVDWGFYSHPTSAKRSLELLAGISEIRGKEAEGLPLEPEKNRRVLKRPEVSQAEVDAHLSALREEALARLRSDIRRIQGVSYRLAVGGVSECEGHTAPVLGATVARRQDFLRSKKKEAEAAFGVGNEVTVLAIAPASPAERAGLQEGDRILSVDGSRTKRTKYVFERLRRSREGDPVLRIARGRERFDVALPRVIGCEQGALVYVSNDGDTETHENEHEMWIPTGLLRFVTDDDELAIAISHQMAHQMIGGFTEQENEPAADELGLKIARQAGFDVAKAPGLWDRAAAEEFWKISFVKNRTLAMSHGGLARRTLNIRAQVAVQEAAGPVDDPGLEIETPQDMSAQ